MTETIELIFSKIPVSYRPYIGGLFHFAPALIIIFMLARSGTSSTASLADWIFLAIAASWTAVGPCLIWHYDMVTLPNLFEKARDELVDSADEAKLYEIVHKSSKISWVGLGLVFAYCLLVTWSAIQYEPITKRFGLDHANKEIWIAFVLGIAITSYISSIGFRFLFRSFWIIREIVKIDLRVRLHHSDGYLGLSFLEKFASKTNWMFVSGFLIIPAMAIDVADWKATNARLWIVIFLIGFALCMFAISTFVVHRKLKTSREELLRTYGTPLNSFEETFRSGYDKAVFVKIDSYRKLFDDAVNVRKWPSFIDVIVPLSLRSVVLPLLVALGSSLIRSSEAGDLNQPPSIENPKSVQHAPVNPGTKAKP